MHYERLQSRQTLENVTKPVRVGAIVNLSMSRWEMKRVG